MSLTINRIENSEARVKKFIDENIIQWVEQYVLNPTKDLALQIGLSQNATNAMFVEKTGFMKTDIVWDYTDSDGNPLSLWLENGFGKGGYDIHVKHKKVLSNGKTFFGKKVRHPGFEGYKIMSTGYKNNKDQLANNIIDEVNNFLESNRL